MSLKIWRFFNVFWLIFFLVVEAFILLRKVDGAGVVQTSKIRVLTSTILLCFFLTVVLIQLIIWLFISTKKH